MLWFMVALALAAKPYVFQLTVLDPQGQPVTTANVQFTMEGTQTHPVHGEAGTWTGDALWLPTGEKQPFAMGQVVSLDVWADGYEKQHVDATLATKKSSMLSVTLTPAPPPPPPEPVEVPAAEPAPTEAAPPPGP